jgi:hypothetical protein
MLPPYTHHHRHRHRHGRRLYIFFLMQGSANPYLPGVTKIALDKDKEDEDGEVEEILDNEEEDDEEEAVGEDDDGGEEMN